TALIPPAPATPGSSPRATPAASRAARPPSSRTARRSAAPTSISASPAAARTRQSASACNSSPVKSPLLRGPVVALFGVSLLVSVGCRRCGDGAHDGSSAAAGATGSAALERNDADANETRRLADAYWSAVKSQDLRAIRDLLGEPLASQFDDKLAEPN